MIPMPYLRQIVRQAGLPESKITKTEYTCAEARKAGLVGDVIEEDGDLKEWNGSNFEA